MRETKKLTLSAILCALSVAVLSLGAFIETLDLSLTALTSLVIAFLYIEVGAPYTWLSWLVTSLLCFLLFPAKPVWAEYLLIFGVYPILKGYIERLPRPLWLVLKLAFFAASVSLFLWFLGWIFGTPVFGNGEMLSSFFYGWFPGWDARALLGLLYAVCLVAAWAYDAFLTVVCRLYFMTLRKKFLRFLK